jgi:hypothetical protein
MFADPPVLKRPVQSRSDVLESRLKSLAVIRLDEEMSEKWFDRSKHRGLDVVRYPTLRQIKSEE